MLSKIKTKNQVTIPQKILDEMNLKVGDNFNVKMEANKIILTPVAMVNMEDMEFAREVKKTYEAYKKNPNKNKQYSDVDKMFEDMDI